MAQRRLARAAAAARRVATRVRARAQYSSIPEADVVRKKLDAEGGEGLLDAKVDCGALDADAFEEELAAKC